MANKYDLKTAVMSIAADASVMTTIGAKVGSGIIASGKTRFLTYIRIERTARCLGATVATGHSGNCMVCAITGISGAAKFATYTASTALSEAAMPFGLAPTQSNVSVPMGITAAMYQNTPDRPDIDHPLIAVGGGSSLMGIHVPSGPACRIFAQYYDE
jgi:hypothetical protein